MMQTTTRATRDVPVARSVDELPSVLAIVVTHDGRTWLRDCLVALNTQTYPLLDVLVVDDASPDDGRPTLKRIAKRHLKKRRWGHLRTRRPLGFGGAINWALSRVRTDADLLMFIHDDAALDQKSVQRMVERIASDDRTAIVGPKIVGWDDPSRLEEVGMASDRFGFPYKGLEEGEIDLGQHDVPSEVFYVTSTCMMMRHDVFRDLRGFDARMRVFAEDLDLCWRARVAGFAVRVEPMAKARHAIALASGLRNSPFLPARYFIRRNRLRTIMKNVSGVRLIPLLPLFLLLTIAEMVAFVILRQPREIFNLARALGWNLITLPQTLSERARVQRRRKVPDRTLGRLMVRESSRLRAAIGQQAGRLEEAWGRRAELVAQRGAQARAVGNRLRGALGAAIVVGLIALAFAFRHVIWAPSIAVGDIVPYPDGATTLWNVFFSPWQPTGLGSPGPVSPALAFSGLFSILGLGDAGAAQKLMLMVLALFAFAGAYRLVAEVVDRPARLLAGAVYVFGNVGYAAVREGALGALFFAAAAPFVVHSLLRLSGWMRPPAWNRGRAVARVALGTAVSAAFVPGSVFVYAVVALVLCALRAFDRPKNLPSTVISSLLGIVAGWALLLPWSATWWSEGGPLQRLTGESADHFAHTFAGHGTVSVLLGQSPDGPALYGLALPVLGFLAVLVPEGQRRRVALALWAVIGVTAVLMSAIGAGILDPIVATPTELGVISAAAYAGLAAVALGAFRLDLPRRGLGWMHAFTLSAMSVAAFLLLAGLAPAALQGAWDPGRDSPAADAATLAQIGSLTTTEAAQTGDFRTIWIGDAWRPPAPSAARPTRPFVVTGPEGTTMRDLFERDTGSGEEELAAVVSSIERGITDRGGALLGAFNVRYAVVEPGPSATEWLAQRDLALVRRESNYLILENRSLLPRAAAYTQMPGVLLAVDEGDPARAQTQKVAPGTALKRTSGSSFAGEEDATGPGVVFLAERNDAGWRATVGGAALERADAGWGNAFTLPPGSLGTLDVTYERASGKVVWAVVLLMAWVVVLGAAFGRSRRIESYRRRV